MMNSKVVELNVGMDITEKKKETVFGWVKFLFVLLIFGLFFHFAIGIEVINGNSMNPTIKNGNALLLNKIFFEPEQSNLVVVKDPHGYFIIKRIIGLPHDIVAIKDGIVYINNQPIKEKYTIGKSIDMNEKTVEAGHYFIMGDNRTLGESLDSRDPSVGTISKDNIAGEAIFSLFPFKTLN
jgi:signal peptidase I